MKLKIDFCDFWAGFSKTDNYFYNLLSQSFELEIHSTPDILIFSCYGDDHKNYNCKRILFSGENWTYENKEYDHLIDHQYLTTDNHFRLPLFALYDGFFEIERKRLKMLNHIDIKNKEFCNFVYSNDSATLRKKFFEKLSQYKKVDSGGKVLNNMGFLVENKRDFITSYKFTIAFENSKAEGYTTEKMFEPLFCRSVPIYWGNSKVDLDFNPNAFLKLESEDGIDTLIEKIIEIDNDDELFLSYLNSNALNLHEEELIKKYKTDLLEWLKKIINSHKDNTKFLKRKTVFSDTVSAIKKFIRN
jgi:hypothetical protein